MRFLDLRAPPAWGVEPVPPADRRLRARDLAVLWGSLGVGLLVMEAGTFLAGLGLARATLAIGVGTLIGTLMLAAAARVGAEAGTPAMVLVRPVLGARGSHLASGLNVLQLVGWTAFELWVMGTAAAVVGATYLGAGAGGWTVGWIALFAVWGTLLALGGPVAVVRQWLEKFGVWAMLAASLYLTYRLIVTVDLGALWARGGDASGFWGMVDLVIAMPVSWLPLVADYSRFARTPGDAFKGTFAGFAAANVWFYLLGVLFVLSARLGPGPSPADLAAAVAALAGGALALGVILVDEVDNVFADIYSAAVSAQNVRPRLGQRGLIVAVGAAGALVAALVRMGDYFNFLLLVGSVFVPLFGLLLADAYAVRRGRAYDHAALYGEGPVVRWPGVAAWAAGVAVYQLMARNAAIGASLPAFATSALLYIAIARLGFVPVPGRPAAGATPEAS